MESFPLYWFVLYSLDRIHVLCLYLTLLPWRKCLPDFTLLDMFVFIFTWTDRALATLTWSVIMIWLYLPSFYLDSLTLVNLFVELPPLSVLEFWSNIPILVSQPKIMLSFSLVVFVTKAKKLNYELFLFRLWYIYIISRD